MCIRDSVKQGSKRDYSAPNPSAKLHDSMNIFWKILEYLPKRKKFHDHPQMKKKSGIYLPMSEPRYIPPYAHIDPSVLDRIDTVQTSDSEIYSPTNLPACK